MRQRACSSWHAGRANHAQGEANADVGIYKDEATHTLQYACVLQAMVAAWRDRKGMGDFAFLNMQLPPSVAPSDGPKNPRTGRMAIRAAEALAVARPGGQTDISGMAVTIDLGGKSAWGYALHRRAPRVPRAAPGWCSLARHTGS